MTAPFRNPDTDSICRELQSIGTIAIVGLSPNENRPSFRIARAMQRHGYRIIPVRPLVDSVLGEKAYASLRDVDVPYDLVDVFRAADALDSIVDDCIAVGAKRLWIQDGIVNEPAARRAAEHGIWTVMDRCILRDFNALCGGVRRSAAEA